jgi:hypothetical protein
MSEQRFAGRAFFPNPDDNGPYNPRAMIAVRLGELLAAATLIDDDEWGPIYGPAGPRIREAIASLAVAHAQSFQQVARTAAL